MGDIRVGILGLGSIGRTHARAIHALEDAEVRVTAYSGSSALDTLEPIDARQVTADELIRAPDVDLVVIATPSDLHAEQALAAMRAGKGVVIEKPLATTAATAREVVRVWRETGVLGATISQRRLESQHLRLKELLDAGELGRPILGEVAVHWWRETSYYSAAPWRTQAPGGGVLMNQALHNVDLLTWMLGPAAEVTGITGNQQHRMAAEDTAVAAVRFHSGAMGTVVASTATPPGRPAKLAIYTTTGFMELDHADVVSWTFPQAPRPEPAEAIASGSSDPAAIGFAGHLIQWRDIVAAVRGERQPAISLAEGLPAVDLIDAVYRSSREGTTIRLEQP